MIKEPADQTTPIYVKAIVAFGISFCIMAVWLEVIAK